MRYEPAQPLARRASLFVQQLRSVDLTVAGLSFCTLMSLMGVAASHSQANLLVLIFGTMVGLIFVSIRICPKMLAKLSIRRTIPEHGIVGQPLSIVYHVENAKRWWPTMSVTLAELDGVEAFSRPPQAYLLHVASGTAASTPAEPMARRRGVYELDRLRVSSSFPFGFVKRAGIQRIADAVLVYPAIGRVDQRVIQMCSPAESAGMRLRPKRGGMEEFYGVKEYREGENPRWIYWRRSARIGTLVAKEMSRVSPPKILLLLDTHIPPGSSIVPADVERAIAMAGSLASAALEQGLPVGLLAWSGEWVQIAPNRGKRHRRDILTELARLPINTGSSQDELIAKASQERKSGTTRVLITPQSRGSVLGDAMRGHMVVLSSSAAEATKWFAFADTVNFSRCMPAGQAKTKG